MHAITYLNFKTQSLTLEQPNVSPTSQWQHACSPYHILQKNHMAETQFPRDRTGPKPNQISI